MNSRVKKAGSGFVPGSPVGRICYLISNITYSLYSILYNMTDSSLGIAGIRALVAPSHRGALSFVRSAFFVGFRVFSGFVGASRSLQAQGRLRTGHARFFEIFLRPPFRVSLTYRFPLI